MIDTSIICGPLNPTIPGEVVVGAISVFFPIGIVVLGVVGHQVIQSEAIMGYHKVDTMVWFPGCTTYKSQCLAYCPG